MANSNHFIIESPFFPLINITANPAYKRDQPVLELVIDSNLTVDKVKERPGRIFAELRIILNDAKTNAPYTFDVVCVCFANTSLNTALDSTKNEAAAACYPVLFAAVREMILTISARQPWGPFSIGYDTSLASATTAADKPKRRPRIKKVIAE